MASKTFNSRIILKHDIEENWNKATNFVPMLGEIIIYDADAEHNYERIKVGDGRNIVNNLSFINDALREELINNNMLEVSSAEIEALFN